VVVLSEGCHTSRVVALPTGTVTFLFTDVEGSTWRWEGDPRAMGALLAEHDDVLRSVIGSHGGYVFSTAGDGIAAAFADPLEAVTAAMEAQETLSLPVRMGVHTGTAEERDGNYFGRTQNRAARIMSGGHGGQILVSDATAALVGDDVASVDLGSHRLADLPAAVHVWQVGSTRFPALRTSGDVVGSLPATLDVFVGRGAEKAELVELVRRHRLVTITGVGGVGKTRVAVEVGRLVTAELDGGVWFVDLMLARAPMAVVEQIAMSLGVRAAPGQTTDERLVEHLQRRRVLLVMDNCEHVVGAAASAVEMLLRSCEGVRVLATSRQPLMVRGEQIVALAPLPVDGPDGLGSGDAVALFVERFQAGHEQLPAVADVTEICRRVDGLALAIELAAARARTLGVDGVLRRLGDHLQLLSGGWRPATDHHVTLQGTLDWSFMLLTADEQVVFDRLGVFVGSFTLEDAIAVTAEDDVDDIVVVDAVSVLVDKSMCTVETRDGATWYRYLEPIRAYAHGHLALAPGTLDEVSTRHTTHFGRIADRLVEELGSPREGDAAAEAERRFPDLRAAVAWATAHDLVDTIESLAWLTTALARRGSPEMSGWFYDIRDRRPDCAMTQFVAATHAYAVSGDLVEGRRRAEHVLQLDHPDAPTAHRALGIIAIHMGEFERAIEHLERYVAFAANSPHVIERVVRHYALAGALILSNRDTGRIAEQIIEDATAVGWPTGIAVGHQVHAAATADTDPQRSLDEYTRVIDIAASVGNWYIEANAQRYRLNVQFAVLPPDELASVTVDVLRRFYAMDDALDVIHTVGFALVVVADAGRLEACARLLGWLSGRPTFHADPLGRLVEVTSTVEESLGDASQSLIDAGRAMSIDDVVDLVSVELDAINH
jgi:predicted ATPase/class 3 adenylate cyclase